MTYSITITNANNYKMRFFSGEVPNANYSINTKLFKQSLPDDDGDNAITINLGKEQSISFPFKLLATSGEDATVGTSASCESVKEKVDYLLGTFLTSGVEDLYSIEFKFNAGGEEVTITKSGIIERFTINPSSQNTNYVAGDISFNVGGGIQ